MTKTEVEEFEPSEPRSVPSSPDASPPPSDPETPRRGTSDGPGRETEPPRNSPRFHEGLVAAAVLVAFCYWAETVVLTLLLALLLTYLLDPLVVSGERLRIPRRLGALLSVLGFIAVVLGGAFVLENRLQGLVRDWSDFSTILAHASSFLEEQVQRLSATVGGIQEPRQAEWNLLLGNRESLRTFLFRQLDSLYAVAEIVAFLPFLVFFMLSEKKRLLERGMELFSEAHRQPARRGFQELSEVLRGYLVGNVIVLAILVLASFLFFLLVGVDYPFLTAVLSGIANLVPYLGAVVAWIPPFAIALAQGRSLGFYVLVASCLTLFHFVAINALFPVLVGRRARVNATAVTISLLFWGWLWGGMGLLLAIPLVAALKVLCDHVEAWRPLGSWLGTNEDDSPEAVGSASR